MLIPSVVATQVTLSDHPRIWLVCQSLNGSIQVGIAGVGTLIWEEMVIGR